MKKYALVLSSLLVSLLSNAQVAVTETGTASPASDSVNTLYTVLIVTGAGLFVFIIIYALARAVNALSSQVGQ